MKKFDYIIIGGGASGLYLGMYLKNSIILEKEKLGKKIIISGGGNCNFTNKKIAKNNYFSKDKNFVSYALDNFSGLFDFLKKNKINWQEKTHGRLFLTNKATDLLNAFVKNQKAQIKTDYEVTNIKKDGDLFVVNNEYCANKLIIATGGMSYGGTDFGIKVAKQFGLKIINTYPALVRFDLEDERFLGLAGLAVQGVKSKQFVDGVVFTKRGIGGPLIYQLSLYHKSGEELKLDFSECEHIPKRLRVLLNDKKELVISPKKTAGFKFAEAMAGGVDTSEICPKTYESKKEKGLYFVGEVIDVTGNLGGYNLHFAFASANALIKNI